MTEETKIPCPTTGRTFTGIVTDEAGPMPDLSIRKVEGAKFGSSVNIKIYSAT